MSVATKKESPKAEEKAEAIRAELAALDHDLFDQSSWQEAFGRC